MRLTRSLVLALAGAGLAASPGAAATAPAPGVLHISSHLAKAAKASLDGAAPVTAPGYGVVEVRTAAGRHVLKVTTAAGVTYSQPLDLDPAHLMRWKGKGYWCVNLLDTSFEVYSTEDCEEEVTDAG